MTSGCSMKPRIFRAPSPETEIFPPGPPPAIWTESVLSSDLSQLQRYAAAVMVRPSAAAATGER